MARTVDPAAHARQRVRILAAAAEEFAARGYDATSTDAIRRRAGIGSGTLFHYFPGKADLLRALFADDLPRLRAVVDQARQPPDPDAGVDLLVGHLIAEVTDPLSPGLAAAAVLRAGHDEQLASVLTDLDEVTHRGLVELLARIDRQHPGRLRFPVESTARWLRGLVDAAHLDLVDRPPSATTGELHQVIAWLLGRA